MKKFRLFLALLIVSCGASVFAQGSFDDGDAIGGICDANDYNCVPGVPGYGDGGGMPVDPSPYDPIPGLPGDDRPGRPDRPGIGDSRDQREVYLGQYYRDQSLDLMRLLNLQSARRQRIESVELTVRDGNSYSSLALVADGYTEDSQSVWGSYVTLHPRRDLTIGQNLRRLRLDVRGKLFIDRIVVRLRDSYQPNPPPYNPPGNDIVLPGYVNQNFYQPGNIDIARVAGVHQYRGYRVTAITVYGMGLRYSARARVLANGMILGHLTFGSAVSGQTVRVQQNLVVGQNLNGLNLLVDDQARIDRVEVRLSRY